MTKPAKFNPYIHHRRSIRKKDHNYADEGFYFVTLLCHNRSCLFGRVEHSTMIINDAGNVANECWQGIPNHYPNVILHEYIIMPNHIHGILQLSASADKDDTTGAGIVADVRAKNFSPQRPSISSPQRSFHSPSKTIGSIVRGFKIGVTKWIRSNTNIHNVWQRDYYEHIIRNDESYQRITNYIIGNPAKWNDDNFFKK